MEYTYKTTWLKGMNTRPEHGVNNSPNGSVAYNEIVRGLEVWEAPADGLNVRKGDKWMRLMMTVADAWVAVVHMGTVYGIVEEVGTPPPPPVSQFPEYFILTDPEGNTRRYVLSEG